jgi:multiple sugar transport system permease protein
VYEAARIDGASGWQSFSQITLPLMRPTILVVMLLGLIYTFRVFDLFYVMTQGGPVNATTVLPFYTYTLSFTSFEFGKGSALSGLMLLMLAAVAFLYLRAIQHEEHG